MNPIVRARFYSMFSLSANNIKRPVFVHMHKERAVPAATATGSEYFVGSLVQNQTAEGSWVREGFTHPAFITSPGLHSSSRWSERKDWTQKTLLLCRFSVCVQSGFKHDPSAQQPLFHGNVWPLPQWWRVEVTAAAICACSIWLIMRGVKWNSRGLHLFCTDSPSAAKHLFIYRYEMKEGESRNQISTGAISCLYLPHLCLEKVCLNLKELLAFQ